MEGESWSGSGMGIAGGQESADALVPYESTRDNTQLPAVLKVHIHTRNKVLLYLKLVCRPP